MAKKLNSESPFQLIATNSPSKPSDVNIPSDILDDCEKLYLNFKKCYDKYAPGKLAFFKFNSTIVNNLDNLKKQGCLGLGRIAVYKSYFRDCKNINNINKKVNKICEKLGSLLKSIGTSTDASLSTLGVRGLFSNKRTEDTSLSTHYKDFEYLKSIMKPTVDNEDKFILGDNKSISTGNLYGENFQINFKVLNHESSYTSPSDISDAVSNIPSNGTAATALKEKLNSVKLEFFLALSNISTCTSSKIPSYAKVMSEFLNDSKITYNNLYQIQHKFKEIYDIKGPGDESESEKIKEIRADYGSYADAIKYYKNDLKSSIAYLERNMTKFPNNWKKDTRNAVINKIQVKNDMNSLFSKIEKADRAIRDKPFIKKEGVNDPTSYSEMLRNLSNSMRITFTNISALEKQVSGNGTYTNAMNNRLTPLALTSNFTAIKNTINKLITNFEIKNIETNAETEKDFMNALNTYKASYEEIMTEYNQILSNIIELYNIDVQNILNEINKKEKQESFDKMKKKVKVAATVAGTSISILSALMNIVKKI